MSTSYDTLAADYEAGRTGYANDLYDALIGYGLNRSMKIVDVGCGTGLASAPLAANGFSVTGVDPSEAMLAYARSNHPGMKLVAGRAEKLPFEDASFDAFISAQTFHQVDRAQAMREVVRVLRPGGLVAIWWKRLMSDDPIELVRKELFAQAGMDVPPSGLTAGFKEFYATPLADHTLRVIPWRVTTRVAEYINYERSRKSVRDALGSHAESYYNALETRLQQQYGGATAPITLGYMHYAYLGKTP